MPRRRRHGSSRTRGGGASSAPVDPRSEAAPSPETQQLERRVGGWRSRLPQRRIDGGAGASRPPSAERAQGSNRAAQRTAELAAAWRAPFCAAFLACGVTAGLAATLQELRFHLFAPLPCLLLTFGPAAGGFFWARLRLAGATPPRLFARPQRAGEAQVPVLQIAGVVLLLHAMTWALVCLLVAQLEDSRGLIASAFVLPPQALLLLLLLPLAILLGLAGAAGQLALRHGVSGLGRRTLGARIAIACALAAGIAASLLFLGETDRPGALLVLTLLPLFAAAGLTVLPAGPSDRAGPAHTPKRAPARTPARSHFAAALLLCVIPAAPLMVALRAELHSQARARDGGRGTAPNAAAALARDFYAPPHAAIGWYEAHFADNDWSDAAEWELLPPWQIAGRLTYANAWHADLAPARYDALLLASAGGARGAAAPDRYASRRLIERCMRTLKAGGYFILENPTPELGGAMQAAVRARHASQWDCYLLQITHGSDRWEALLSGPGISAWVQRHPWPAEADVRLLHVLRRRDLLLHLAGWLIGG